jgi:uncharacterized protein YxjI
MFKRHAKGDSPLTKAVHQAESAPQAGGGLLTGQGLGGPDLRFKMKQKMFSFGDDFWIENERGRKAYKVNGKLFRLKDNLSFEDAHGKEIYQIKAKMVDVLETMNILDANGHKAAVVKNALFTPFRDKWHINLPGKMDLVAKGNIMQHEYDIKVEGRGNPVVAEVSKKWFRLRDTYGVEVEGGVDPALILAITVVIDMMEHNGALKSNAGGGIDVL